MTIQRMDGRFSSVATGHLSASEDRECLDVARRLRQQETADLRWFLMELAGLEPATSWVRCRRSSDQEMALCAVFSDEGLECPQHLPQHLTPTL
jgi:hypothetical protein